MRLGVWAWVLLTLVPWSASQVPLQRSVQDVSTPAAVDNAPGPYFALVIGISKYPSLHPLNTPLRDADAVADLLRTKFGFQTTVLHEATRLQIVSALWDYRRMLPKDSNLLIYYAGHGSLDADTKIAYWLPFDAESSNSANWISSDDINAYISAIPSQHILIISDSCYSGSLSFSRDAAIDTNPANRLTYLTQMLQRRSRTLLASGGNEPVDDGGADGHSVFAGVLLQTLREMDQQQFSASDIFTVIQHRVAGHSQQLPQYSSINRSGHDGGDFVFSTDMGHRVATLGGRVDIPTVAEVDVQEQANVLLSRYQSAFEREDLGALQRLWPTMPEDKRKGNEKFFNTATEITLTYKLLGKPVFADNTGQLVFSQDMKFKQNGRMEKLDTPKVTMTLQKVSGQRGGDEWQISNIK
ncbi:MAG TPA: caspase family protein [Terracidiphilus sp.]|jgi:uncharacterized caspase-like protein